MVAGFLTFCITLAVVAIALKILFPLPSRDNFPADQQYPAQQSEWAQQISGFAEEHPGESGLLLLDKGVNAFAMRLAMVRDAQQTVDAQYYIWDNDLTGKMLLQEMIRAADRGVRVRLLIDDNPTAGLDHMWAAINSHPMIDVRIFNPLTIRKFRPANYLFDFPRLNRRMHNKSLTVDHIATVVGGRNIGDVYFGVGKENLFIDLDTLAIGSVVKPVANQFDKYWNSDSAYPAQLILSKPGKDDIEKWRTPQFDDPELARSYREATDEALKILADNDVDDILTWAPVQLFYDDPSKGLNKANKDDLLIAQLEPAIASSRNRFDLVSGYFVPGSEGTDLLTGLAKSGVSTRVVTNGIEVTDVAIVHAGYTPARRPMLKSGIHLFEARPRGDQPDFADTDHGTLRFSGGGESVHAKTFAIDGERLFVGSFNFDPRSALLNCEMGFIIDSPKIASSMVEGLDQHIPDSAYKVTLDDDDNMVWTSTVDGQTTSQQPEPGTTAISRGLIWFLSKLPIAWML